MRPESGASRPIASLRMRLLPEPATPRRTFVCPWGTRKLTPLRTSFSSKRRYTSSNSMQQFCSGGITSGMRSHPEDDHEDARYEEVHNNDSHRRDDDGLRGRATHSLRASGGRHAVVTADTGDDESEEAGLNQSLRDVL